MILIQFLFSIVIPVIMTIWGFRAKKRIPEYGEGRLSYRSKRSGTSEEAWLFSNNLFASLLFAAGLNIGIITVIFFVSVVFVGYINWFMVITLVLTQITGSALLLRIVTEGLLRRTFDRNGDLIETDEEQDDEDVEEDV